MSKFHRPTSGFSQIIERRACEGWIKMTKKLTDVSASAPISFDPGAKGPLSGLRVIDMSRVVAGNMMTALLGDLGAEIIKVESFGGDGLRDWRNDGISFHWKVYGRNKRSIALEPRTAEERDLLLELIDGTDVLVENFRPDTLEKMGLAPETLLSRNRNLVIVRISGFGQSGPYSQRPGFGTLVKAMSGFASKTGFSPTGSPFCRQRRSRTWWPDYTERRPSRRRCARAMSAEKADRSLTCRCWSRLTPPSALTCPSMNEPARLNSALEAGRTTPRRATCTVAPMGNTLRFPDHSKYGGAGFSRSLERPR